MQAAIEQRVCIHCGTRFSPTARRKDFCCAGCQFVHDLIARNGLGQFYDLQDGALPPVQALVFQKRDYAWLEEASHAAGGMMTLDVQGLSCIGCAWLIEKLFMRKPGALAIRVDPALGQLDIRWQAGALDVAAFGRELQSYGYLVGPPGKAPSSASRALIPRIGLCAALALNTMLFTLPRYFGMGAEFQFATLFERLALLFGTLSFLIGGSYFFVRSWRSLRARVLHMDLPISLGLIAAYAGSVFAWTQGAHGFVYFDFVATFTFLMLVGRWLQQKMIERNRNQLLAAQTEPAPVRRPTGEKLKASEIGKETEYAVAPGQTVPVRSRLRSRAATLGLGWINGESDTTTAQCGSLVPAGAVNCGQESIVFEALEAWSDSLLAKLLRITPEHAPRDPVSTRFIQGYIVGVLGVACAGFAGWWMATGSFLPALQALISVLVVSCPCASGVALPLAEDLAVWRLRQIGVFIRNSGLWAKLERVRNVIFDKTGTLTPESISLRNPEVLVRLTPDERAVLLAMVFDSFHPVGACIREQLLADGVETISAKRPEETIGFGLELRHAGSVWHLGRASWIAAPTGGDCVFARDGEVLASFWFGEEPRADAAGEIAALHERDCRIFILSGDRQAKVEAMADRLGVSRKHCRAEMSPEEKASWVERFDAHDTLYIGDGANDSLAFDAAWCSGTPAVDLGLLEQKADFYFLGRGLAGVRALLDMAAIRRRTAHTVVAFAIAYNAVAIALCLAGKMNPLVAAVLMPASSLVSLAIVFIGLGKAEH